MDLLLYQAFFYFQNYLTNDAVGNKFSISSINCLIYNYLIYNLFYDKKMLKMFLMSQEKRYLNLLVSLFIDCFNSIFFNKKNMFISINSLFFLFIFIQKKKGEKNKIVIKRVL